MKHYSLADLSKFKRKVMHITQGELARDLFVSLQKISSFECDNISLSSEEEQLLCKVLHIDVEMINNYIHEFENLFFELIELGYYGDDYSYVHMKMDDMLESFEYAELIPICILYKLHCEYNKSGMIDENLLSNLRDQFKYLHKDAKSMFLSLCAIKSMNEQNSEEGLLCLKKAEQYSTDIKTLSVIEFMKGDYQYKIGNYLEAYNSYNYAKEMMCSTLNYYRCLLADIRIASILAIFGKYKEAITKYEECLKAVRRFGDLNDKYRKDVLCFLSLLLLICREYGKAKACLAGFQLDELNVKGIFTLAYTSYKLGEVVTFGEIVDKYGPYLDDEYKITLKLLIERDLSEFKRYKEIKNKELLQILKDDLSEIVENCDNPIVLKQYINLMHDID